MKESKRILLLLRRIESHNVTFSELSSSTTELFGACLNKSQLQVYHNL